MEQRVIKFRAFYKDLNIMLDCFSVNPSGTIGMDLNDFSDRLGDEYDVEEGEIKNVITDDDKGGELVSTYLEGDDYIWLEEKQFVLIQYSGIDDESGENIYEGDRIEEDGMKGTVIFQAGAFMINWDMEDVLVDPIGFDKQNSPRKLKIIGNIFQP